MNDEVQSIINEVCNKRIGIGQTDNDKWWLHQMWVAQHKIADYLMNNDYKQRIDKAIEYVENNNFYKTGMTEEGICYVVSCDKKELLDILKGSDTNE